MTDKEWDRLLHIRTSGRDDSRADTFRYPYEPTPYAVLERLAGSGYLRKEDVLLDYGCGKGRVGFFLSSQAGCRVTGIDYDERLLAKALENRESAVKSRKTEFVLSPAEKYAVPPEANRFYFFNPFSVELLQAVWGQIRESFYDNPRELLLFFYYPSEEYISWLMTVPELEFLDEIFCGDLFEGDERERILIFQADG